MRAGRLNNRITIQQATETQGSSGSVTETWSTYIKRWASVEPLTGQEYFAAQAINAKVSLRIRLRYDSEAAAITPKMRVLYGSRVFDIHSPPLNQSERNKEIHLMVSEQIE